MVDAGWGPVVGQLHRRASFAAVGPTAPPSSALPPAVGRNGREELKKENAKEGGGAARGASFFDDLALPGSGSASDKLRLHLTLSTFKHKYQISSDCFITLLCFDNGKEGALFGFSDSAEHRGII